MKSIPGHLYAAIAAGIVALVVRFFIKGYRHRKHFHNLPGPPHHWLWGHLKLMGEMQAAAPHGTHPHTFMLQIALQYAGTDPVMYIDLWPFMDSMIVPLTPELSQQFTADDNQDKHRYLKLFVDILAGKGNLVSVDGPFWKKWRSIMNPGFAASHIMTLVPGIVDDGIVFCDILGEKACKGDVIRMENLTTALTIDIIGKVIMDLSFNCQRGRDEFVDAFRDQMNRLPSFSYGLASLLPSPWIYYKRWDNARRMDAYVGTVLETRFAQSRTEEKSVAMGKQSKKRAVIDLALESYLKEEQATGKDVQNQVMDATFSKIATSHIKAFMFAGHDTTSSVLSYAYHLLAKHPGYLQEIREEHDRVLGSMKDTPQNIKTNPHLLNQLDYTLSVAKEVLRLFPPASSTRLGRPGFVLYNPKTGEQYPASSLQLWSVSYVLHRLPAIWGPTADKFDPSRFMPPNASSLPPNAFRPFETGKRSCIGQDLALVETKIILALTLRAFDFTTAFDRLDDLKGDGFVFAADPRWRSGKTDAWGEEAYQVLIATAKPREGMPMLVTKRDAAV